MTLQKHDGSSYLARIARRGFVLGMGAALAMPRVFAQEVKQLRRVGMTFNSNPEQAKPYLEAFVQGMEEHGLRLERDYVVYARYAQGRPERFPTLIAELLAARAEVLVVNANSTTHVAKAATSTVPIVMATSADPEATGLVQSLARPGGNITGLTNLTATLLGKRLQLLRELLPAATRIVYLSNLAVAGFESSQSGVEQAGQSLGFQVTSVSASNVEEIDRALATLLARRPDALLVGNSAVLWSHRRRIIAFCALHRIPASYGWSEAVIDGGLISYSGTILEGYKRSAYYVARIFGGARPGELPIEQAKRYELLVNKKTADSLGITIPDPILVGSDRVIR